MLPLKSKFLNLLLIIFSLIGYLEWGENNHMFLFQAEADIISKLFTNPLSVLHPFILIPFAGQLLLLITLFQKKPNKLMTNLGMSCIGILLGFVFVAGVMSLNFKIVCSTVPFLIVAVVVVKNFRSISTDKRP